MEEKKQSKTILLYGHPACHQVLPVMTMLKQTHIKYQYINIFDDEEARGRVMEINHGYQSVPTLVFPDGTTLTEPSAEELSDKLKSMGYQVPLSARLAGNFWMILMIAAIIFAILRILGLF